MSGKGMTKAFLEWRKRTLPKREGHDTTEYQRKKKQEWKDEDDTRKRVA